MYGLYPKKGSIGVGFDADIALWDPNRKETIRQEILHHGADYTPWEGFAVTGWPVHDDRRGEVVAEEGQDSRRAGDGPRSSTGRSRPTRRPRGPTSDEGSASGAD